MKKILIHSRFDREGQLFNPNERDGYNDPYIYLRERLRARGYELDVSRNHSLDDVAAVLFFDAPSVKMRGGLTGAYERLKALAKRDGRFRDLFSECRSRPEIARALFLWEAPAVIPENWDPSLHSLFDLIFTWSDSFVENPKFVKFCWPQSRVYPVPTFKPFSDRKFLVNISMNKRSNHPRELYSARVRSIRYFESTYSERFDLFGMGWNQALGLKERLLPSMTPMFTSYRGIVKNKWDVLPHYRFAICYENIRDEPGWVTEKIFDCLRAGCVPVYWGANNINQYVDEAAFIDRTKFRDDQELGKFLVQIDEPTFMNYLTAGAKFLQSEKFAMFSPVAFADKIIDNLFRFISDD